MKIAVVGGGPAGLYCACALQTFDNASTHQIDLFETSHASVHSRGLGYTLQTLGLNLLKRLDAEFEQTLFAAQAPQIITQALYKTHREARTLPFTRGVSVTRDQLIAYLTQRAQALGVKIHARRIDQSKFKRLARDYDLVIGADGLSGTSRGRHGKALGARSKALNLHYSWFTNETEQPRTEACFYAMPADEGIIMLTSYPLTAHKQVVVIEMCAQTLNRGRLQGRTPAQLTDYLNTVMRQQGDVMQLEAAGLPWYRFHTNTIDQMHRGNIALIGDAAMAFHFSAGQGVTNAFTMAFTLAQCVNRHADLGTALAHYSTASRMAMRQPASLMQRRASWLEHIDMHFAAAPESEWLDLFLHGHLEQDEHAAAPSP